MGEISAPSSPGDLAAAPVTKWALKLRGCLSRISFDLRKTFPDSSLIYRDKDWTLLTPERVLMQHRAEQAIQTCAPNLTPSASILYINHSGKQTHTLDSTDSAFNSDTFADWSERRQRIRKSDSCKTPKWHLQEAIKEILAEHDSASQTVSFCGRPVTIKNHQLIPILQFNCERFHSHPRLVEPFTLNLEISKVGFLESLIYLLLEEVSERSEHDFDEYKGLAAEDPAIIVRNAGRMFSRSIWCATQDKGFWDIFDTLNVLASIPYEGAAIHGRIVFAPKTFSDFSYQTRLCSPVNLSEYHRARKIIEMASAEFVGVCQGANGICGFSQFDEIRDFFNVAFTGHHKWELNYGNQPLMKVAYGLPSSPCSRLNRAEFRSAISHFGSARDETKLWEIVQTATRQSHGTMIVVSDGAAEEADRLRHQSTLIAPICLSASLVSQLTTIDGAVLITPAGTCHAIGVILDGMATTNGDTSRGARFNSAIRYAESAKYETLCVVVSEDGNVDLIHKPH